MFNFNFNFKFIFIFLKTYNKNMKLERHNKLINQYKIMRLCNKVQHKGQTIKDVV